MDTTESKPLPSTPIIKKNDSGTLKKNDSGALKKKAVLSTSYDDDDDHDHDHEHINNRNENSSKIKCLPPSVIKDIEQKNVARKLAGLPPISVRARRCLMCGALFQSAGNRTCGCASRIAGTIAGREII